MNKSRFIVHTMPVEVQISLRGEQIFDGFPIYFGYILACQTNPTNRLTR